MFSLGNIFLERNRRLASILIMKRLNVNDAEDNARERMDPFASPEEQNDDSYPNCYNISGGLAGWRMLPIPASPPPPAEYVHVPMRDIQHSADEDQMKLGNFIARWNMAWESGPLRTQIFFEDEVPEKLLWLDKYPGVDFRLVFGGKSSPYVAYEPIFHLLTLKTLKACGLPPLRRGFWPQFGLPWNHRVQRYLPGDFLPRLQSGFSRQLWPYLSQQPRRSFSEAEPVVMLSNDIDFWLPYLDQVAQTRLKAFDRVPHDEDTQAAVDSYPPGSQNRFERPRKGGDVWLGAQEAHEVMSEMVDAADERGRLRGIVDAVRSHRVEDDFSPRWSFAKEDFERKLYHKRTKVKVTFVELDDTVPTHGPDAEADGNLLWQDLFTLCDPKERRVLVCLRNGTTRATEIAEELGYANHSPVSKALAEIRSRVAKLLDLE